MAFLGTVVKYGVAAIAGAIGASALSDETKGKVRDAARSVGADAKRIAKDRADRVRDFFDDLGKGGPPNGKGSGGGSGGSSSSGSGNGPEASA